MKRNKGNGEMSKYKTSGRFKNSIMFGNRTVLLLYEGAAINEFYADFIVKALNVSGMKPPSWKEFAFFIENLGRESD